MLPQTEFRTAQSGWTQVGPGIQELQLHVDGQTGRETKLQRYDVGAKTTDVAFHTFYEEVYIIEGTLTDITLDKTFPAGSYAFRHPAMRHGPYRSDVGCLMLVICVPPGYAYV
jgi:anti-sigma factor ChrR (cupin superfamily)